MAIITPVSRIDLSKEIDDWNNAIYGKEVRQANTSAFEKIQTIINGTVVNVNDAAKQIDEIKQLADASAKNAAASASAAATSEANSLASERNAKNSESNASSSEANALNSKNNALESALNALVSEQRAKTSETNASTSEQNAKNSESNASSSEANALNSANNASESAESALLSRNDAEQFSIQAQRYVVGGTTTGDAKDNAKYYYEEVKNMYSKVDAASKFLVPDFYIDFITGELKSVTEAKGMRFWVEDGEFYGEMEVNV